MDSNRDITNFSPVFGGFYYNTNLNDEGTRGMWWGSEAYNILRRQYLGYNGTTLSNGSYVRYFGYYIRCVSEEKTVLDLTYMQDITLGYYKNLLHTLSEYFDEPKKNFKILEN